MNAAVGSTTLHCALVLLGVVDSQVEAVSFGKEKPAVQGSDEDAMAKNRRAEISYR
jgi:peptidoglycan-associated lipoprotein